MNNIPIEVAKEIAEKYDLEQIVIIGRKSGFKGYETTCTYGINKLHCAIAAKIGDFLKYKIMGWNDASN